MNIEKSSQLLYSWQENDYKSILEALEQEKCKLLIKGKDFSSPYSVISSVAYTLDKNGYYVLHITPNNSNISIDYIDFRLALQDLCFLHSKRGNLLPNLIKDISRSDTLEEVAKFIVQSADTSVLLNTEANELLLFLGRWVKNSTVVFFIHDYNQLDDKTRELIQLVTSDWSESSFRGHFEYLTTAKYVFLDSSGISNEFSLSKTLTSEKIVIKSPTENGIIEMAKDLFPSMTLSDEQISWLHTISGGSITLLEILLNYISSNNPHLDTNHEQCVINSILAERFLSLGDSGINLRLFLNHAALIGEIFPLNILKQVYNEEKVNQFLALSDSELLTKHNNLQGSFLLSSIWHFFNSNISDCERKEIGIKIERAVYSTNPVDYEMRALFLEKSGNTYEACELYLLACNNNFKNNREISETLLQKTRSMCYKEGLNGFYKMLISVYDAIRNNDYSLAANLLDDQNALLSKRLLLLHNYLLSICLHMSDNAEDLNESIIIMRNVSSNAKEYENGLWYDAQSSLISFIVNNGENLKEAQEIHRELYYYLIDNSSSDHKQIYLNSLKRKWNALYSVEKSVSKTLESVKYFQNTVYTSQYIMALNNHAANLIVLGKYSEAIAFLSKSMQCYTNKISIVDQKYILNNYILASILNKTIFPQDAISVLSSLISTLDINSNSFIIIMNYYIYHALCNSFSVAEVGFKKLISAADKMNDDYFLYYAYANLASVLFLLGEKDKAINILKEKCSVAPKLSHSTERYYLDNRTKLLVQTMVQCDNCNIEARDYDMLLVESEMIGTQTDFIYRGFLYSDSQFWSEP